MSCIFYFSDNPATPWDAYTANFYPMKTTGTGNCGVPAGKICTIYGKGLLELRGNLMIITGFPCRDPAIPSPRNFHGVKTSSVCSGVQIPFRFGNLKGIVVKSPAVMSNS